MDETQVRERLTETQEANMLLAEALLTVVQMSEDADTVRTALSALTRTTVGMHLLHTSPIS